MKCTTRKRKIIKNSEKDNNPIFCDAPKALTVEQTPIALSS